MAECPKVSRARIRKNNRKARAGTSGNTKFSGKKAGRVETSRECASRTSKGKSFEEEYEAFPGLDCFGINHFHPGFSRRRGSRFQPWRRTRQQDCQEGDR